MTLNVKIGGLIDFFGDFGLRHKSTLCLKKNIPYIIDCNLKTNYQILIIFGTNIPDTTCHQRTI